MKCNPRVLRPAERLAGCIEMTYSPSTLPNAAKIHILIMLQLSGAKLGRQSGPFPANLHILGATCTLRTCRARSSPRCDVSRKQNASGRRWSQRKLSEWIP